MALEFIPKENVLVNVAPVFTSKENVLEKVAPVMLQPYFLFDALENYFCADLHVARFHKRGKDEIYCNSQWRLAFIQ